MHEILLFACIVAALAAVWDWRSGTIPNWLTIGVVIAAPLAHAYAHRDSSAGVWPFVIASVVGAVVCGMVPFLLFFKNSVGAGDVKLLACMGAVLGAKIGIEAEFYCFVVAALVGPARLAYEGRLFRTMRDAVLVMVHPRRHANPELLDHVMTRFSLGPAVFIGTALASWLHWRAV